MSWGEVATGCQLEPELPAWLWPLAPGPGWWREQSLPRPLGGLWCWCWLLLQGTLGQCSEAGCTLEAGWLQEATYARAEGLVASLSA